MKKRTVFFIDGFNLYHSLVEVSKRSSLRTRVKWLDLTKLVSAYTNPKFEELSEIYYFSALYNYDQKKKNRHSVYIAALKNSGVKVVLGRFKAKDAYCPLCRKKFTSHEEKRTDVNIALYLLELAYKDAYDTAVIVSGDTDLIPAMEMVKQDFPAKRIGILSPFNRHNSSITQAADFKRNVSISIIEDSIFPPSLILSDGKKITCPVEWNSCNP